VFERTIKHQRSSCFIVGPYAKEVSKSVPSCGLLVSRGRNTLQAEALERAQQAESVRRRRAADAAARRRRHSSDCGQRVEVWISADGSSLSQTQNGNDADDADDLGSLPLVEVNA